MSPDRQSSDNAPEGASDSQVGSGEASESDQQHFIGRISFQNIQIDGLKDREPTG